MIVPSIDHRTLEPSRAIILSGFPIQIPDRDLRERIRDHLSNDIIIEEISFRSIVHEAQKRAFLSFQDSTTAELALSQLQDLVIRQHIITSKLDDGLRNTAQSQRAANDQFTGRTASQPVTNGLQSLFHTSFLPPSQPLNPNTSSNTSSKGELVQLFISPLPVAKSDLELCTALHRISKDYFFNTGAVTLKRNPTHVTAFIDLVNHSPEPSALIVSKMKAVSFEGVVLKVQFQKTPIRIRQVDGNNISPNEALSISQIPNQLLHLHIAAFPQYMTEESIIFKVKSILLLHFGDEGTVFLRRKNDYVMAFADVYNRTTEYPELMIRKMQTVIIGDHLIKVSFQRSTATRDSTSRFASKDREDNVTSKLWNGNNQEEGLDKVESQAENHSISNGYCRTSPPRSHALAQHRSRSSRSRSPQRTYQSNPTSRHEFIEERNDSFISSSSKIDRPQVRRSNSTDPFAIVHAEVESSLTSSSSKSNEFSSLLVSLDDPASLKQLAQPIHSPSNSTSFNRTISTRLSFGYLSIFHSQLALASSSTSPFSNQEELQLQYEKFLISQSDKENKEHYFNFLENVGKFSKRNKLFSEIAEALVDLDDGI